MVLVVVAAVVGFLFEFSVTVSVDVLFHVSHVRLGSAKPVLRQSWSARLSAVSHVISCH